MPAAKRATGCAAAPPTEAPLEIYKPSDDPAAGMGEIIQAVADGDLLPSEGERLAALVKAKAELTGFARSRSGMRRWQPRSTT